MQCGWVFLSDAKTDVKAKGKDARWVNADEGGQWGVEQWLDLVLLDTGRKRSARKGEYDRRGRRSC